MLLRDESEEVEEQRRAELLLWSRADVSPQCALTNDRVVIDCDVFWNSCTLTRSIIISFSID
jgi:hypothetical protein